MYNQTVIILKKKTIAYAKNDLIGKIFCDYNQLTVLFPYKTPDLKFYVLDSMPLFIFLSIHIDYTHTMKIIHYLSQL